MSDEAEVVLAENRRLRREVRLLGERLDAFERSRWWRLHPRFLLRRRTPAGSDEQAPPASDRSAATPASSDVGARFLEEILPSLTFSRDTFTDRLAALDPIVARLEGRAARILEIGSYEGMSACYFLWRLPDATVTCVDTFGGGIDDRPALEHSALERTFDTNVATVDATRVEKSAGDSRAVLLDLQRLGRTFDLVYVDGSHLALDVLVDAALCWRLVPDGGVIVFDDYRWNALGDDALLRPGTALDAFLQLVAGKHELLLADALLGIRKSVADG